MLHVRQRREESRRREGGRAARSGATRDSRVLELPSVAMDLCLWLTFQRFNYVHVHSACVTVLFLFCSCFFFLNIYEMRIEERIYSGTSLKVIRTVSEVPIVYNSISEIRTPLYIFWLSSVSTIERFLHCTCAYMYVRILHVCNV